MTEEERQVIFKDWLKNYSRIIYKITRAYEANSMDRDDLFQEVIIQMWRSVPSFKAQSSVLTWIYRIALNTALKWVRRERRVPSMEPIENAQHVLIETENNLDAELKWLYGEIYKLDFIDRSLVLLLLDNISYKEIANVLGISESNVGVKIYRIKKYLTEQSKK